MPCLIILLTHCLHKLKQPTIKGAAAHRRFRPLGSDLAIYNTKLASRLAHILAAFPHSLCVHIPPSIITLNFLSAYLWYGMALWQHRPYRLYGLYIRQLNRLHCCSTPGRMNCKLPHIVQYMSSPLSLYGWRKYWDSFLLSSFTPTESDCPCFYAFPWTFCYFLLLISPLCFILPEPSHLYPWKTENGMQSFLTLNMFWRSGLFLWQNNKERERGKRENVIDLRYKQKMTGLMSEAFKVHGA